MSILPPPLITQYFLKPVKILADASLPGLDASFKKPFKLTSYQNKQMLMDALPYHDVLLCRSTLKVNAALLKNSKLSCVATASSGVDHIDKDYLKTQNIALFDAKGCNAEAVADYVLATLAYLKIHNKISGSGMRAGVVGAGEVGSRVIQHLKALGFKVFAYDPLKPNFASCTFEALTHCDVLCIHANLHNTKPYPTKNLLNTAFFEALKPNTVIINAARGGIIDETELLSTQKNIIYCTDVYLNEPSINPEIINYATLCTPHIAGHSIEAKQNAVIHLSQKLHAHFSLTYSLRTPTCSGYPDNIKTTGCLGQAEARRLEEIFTKSMGSILNLYNPLAETLKLKKVTDKQAAFTTLRRQHRRHHFNDTLMQRSI